MNHDSNVYKSIPFWKGNGSENPNLASILTKNVDFLRKSQKNHFFDPIFLNKANKHNFELKMPKSLDDDVKTLLEGRIFFFRI